ncbi:hypothetical protein AB0J47_42100 [Nocardia sp. NPDC049737]|uniref:hypothetical protein n=1 Tax=Nocardia sp. NPDC049737 TaxID=3154358 RepID=UPI003428AD26
MTNTTENASTICPKCDGAATATGSVPGEFQCGACYHLFDAVDLPAIDPVITEAAADLIKTVVALASGSSVEFIYDQAKAAALHAQALVEALDIEMQGGAGAIEDGYRPADRKGVVGAIRGFLTRAVAERLTWRDNDGHMHMLWSN